MKQPPALFLVLGGTSVLVLGAYFVLFRPPGSAPARGARPGPEATSVQASSSAALAAVGEEDGGAPAVGQERELLPAEPAGADPFAAGEVRIRGSVLAPPGVPPEEGLRVVSLEEALAPRKLYGAGGLFAGGEAQDRPSFLDSVPVAPDGSFEVRFPSGRGTGWLALGGRYLYLERCVRVDLASSAPVLLKPRAGAWVHGTVLLPEGVGREELEGLQLELGASSGQFSMLEVDSGWVFDRICRAAADGAFEFRAVDASRQYGIEARPPTLASFTRDGLTLEEGRELVLEVRLVRGATVSGRVVDETGAPVAGAEVRASQAIFWGFPTGQVARAESDANGAFELRAVPPGRAELVADREGLLESATHSLEVADEERHAGVELVVEAGSSVAGQVRWDDGRPAANVEVDVGFDPAALMGMTAMNAARGAEGAARTDADGRFVVGGLGKGPFAVTAEAKDGADHKRTGRVSGVRPGADDVALELRPLPSLTGRVVDASAAPVTTFQVKASAQGEILWMPGDSVEKGFESADGSFVLSDLTEGTWEVSVAAAGYGPAHPLEVVLPLAPGTPASTFVLLPAASVAGGVLDTFGRPVPGAKVTVAVESSKTFARLAGEVSLPETYADEEGLFLLEGLSGGLVSLVARHPDFAESVTVPVEVVPGEVLRDVVLHLRAGGILAGLVYDKEGDPARGARLFVQDTSTWETISNQTAEDGSFRIEKLRPGPWQVSAMIGDLGAGKSEDGGTDMSSFLENLRFTMVEVVEGEEAYVVLGAPPEDPVRVHGRVLHGDQPVPGALLSFLPGGEGGYQDIKLTHVDSQGAYEVELAKPGSYLVNVQHVGDSTGFSQNNLEFSETIPAGDEHELDLELPVASIAGRVLDEHGAPLAQERVSLTTEGGVAYGTVMGGQYAESTSDADGRYAFEFLRPGEYTVSAGGSVFGGAFGTHASHGRVVRGGVSVGEGDAIDGVDFRLPGAGEIAGQVVDAGGAVVTGATIFVRDGAGKPLERFSMITSGPDGSFRYTGVAPGRYTVQARTSELVSQSEEWLEVRAEETTSVRLTLGQGTILLVSVSDESGAEVRARISVTDSRGREVNGMVAFSDLMQGGGFSAAEQRLGPIPPDRYEVVAVAEDGRSVKKPVSLSGQGERRLKLRLK